MFLLFVVLCARFERVSSGKGQVIDAAMVDGVASLMSLFWGVTARSASSTRRSAGPTSSTVARTSDPRSTADLAHGIRGGALGVQVAEQDAGKLQPAPLAALTGVGQAPCPRMQDIALSPVMPMRSSTRRLALEYVAAQAQRGEDGDVYW
jgi:hypothetical protein